MKHKGTRYYGQRSREINRNMGCIETVTWDSTEFKDFQINRNMGCIETEAGEKARI